MPACRTRSEQTNYLRGSRLAAIAMTGLTGATVLQWDHWGAAPNWISAAFLLACAFAILHRVMTAFGWVIVLDVMNQPARAEMATRIWLLTDSRKWLPSRNWGYATRSSLAPKVGVSVSSASASRFLELILLTLALTLVSLPGLWLALPEVFTTFSDGEVSWSVWLSLTLISLPVSFLGWMKMRSIKKYILRRWETLRSGQYRFSAVGRALLFYAAIACLNGLLLSCLLRCLPADTAAPNISLAILIAASSCAWLWGLFASMSTKGWVHRECCLAFLLLPWLPLGTGIMLAVLARLVQVFAEVACVGWVIATDGLCDKGILPRRERIRSVPQLHPKIPQTLRSPSDRRLS